MKVLAKAMPSERVGSGEQIFTVFGHMENAYRQPDWVKDKDGLRAPVDDIDGRSVLLSKSVVMPGMKIHFEVLAAEAECHIGIAIGFNDERSFHLIELVREDGLTTLRCHAYNREFKTLARIDYPIKKEEWKNWVPFDVEIRQKELTWKIGKSKTYVTRCKNPDLSGKLGLYIEGKEALEGGDKERAAPLLAQGIAIAKKAKYSKAKRLLLSQLPKLLRRADPYHGSGRGDRREAAKALIGIAQKYEKGNGGERPSRSCGKRPRSMKNW